MEFLKSIIGDELYAKVEEAVNKHNGDEANKDKQIKLANLAEGGYVSKDKFSALEATIGSKDTELKTANDLIKQLKAATKSDDDAQKKIVDYEAQVKELQTALADTKLNSAIKVALLEAKAMDIDYLTFKLKEKGEKLELDENDHIKGWEDKISGLKTQFPAQFESSSSKKIDENKLPDDDSGKTFTRSEILKMPYAERAKIYNENPDAYNEAMKN